MPLAPVEKHRPSPKGTAGTSAIGQFANDRQLKYRHRFKLATRRGRGGGGVMPSHRSPAGLHSVRHHAHAGDNTAPAAELTAEFLDLQVHELEELAESVGRFSHRLRLHGYIFAKRTLDIAISLIAIICLAPVLLIAALIIKLTDGGSVFYAHTRVGLDGNEFSCFKFRSMVPNADAIKTEMLNLNFHSDSRTFKVPDDPRITRFGRIMRKLSIDELPQLWNVLIGDMSIVGPRPPVPSEVEQYSLVDMDRLTVKPGLTCIWQVCGRSRIAFPEQLQMDLDYIDNRGMLLDLKLMALTVPAVISGDGAY